MSRLLITGALLLSFSTAGAQRLIEQLERPVELTLVGVDLPSDVGGTVSFKNCSSCTYSTHRTTEETVFEVNGQALALGDFLRVVEEIHDLPGTAESEALVTVFLDLASERVTRIALRR